KTSSLKSTACFSLSTAQMLRQKSCVATPKSCNAKSKPSTASKRSSYTAFNLALYISICQTSAWLNMVCRSHKFGTN
ncbi:acrB/AcrD/AcrF family protein, partial [Vibrio parahaemolyticus V-223/04]